MATMYPDSPEDFNDSMGERQVFDALRSLEDRYIVFHSLRWFNQFRRDRHKEALEGEADFLIIDPDRGLLVIEVKSGGVRVANANWYQTNLHTGEERVIQDPAAQAGRSAHFLRQLLIAHPAVGNPIRLFSAVWFPSVPFSTAHLPTNCPAEIVLNEQALASPRLSINRVFDFWVAQLGPAKLGQSRLRSVIDVLAPEYGIMPTFRSGMELRNKQLVRLTAEQSRIFDYLDEQPSAVISGPAGSGKTLLALEIAKRIAASGEDVLFLCYNSALRSYLRDTRPIERVSFHTFHSFASGIMKRDMSFDELEQALIERLSNEELRISNLVIDEAQDFRDPWIRALAKATGGRLFVFYDRNQLLYSDEVPEWIREAECRLVLRRVCRNSQQIARTVARIIGRPLGECQHLPVASKPTIHVSKGQSDSEQTLRSLLHEKLTSQGLNPGEIAILSPDPERLCASPLFADLPFSQEYSSNTICVTTIRKFKGLEAPVVIINDVDAAQLSESAYRRLLYVGCSRAVHELHVMFKGIDDAAMHGVVKALGDGTPMAANVKSLCFLLAANTRAQ